MGGVEQHLGNILWYPYKDKTVCEFDCIAEQNAPHFRHFATQISACIADFTM